MASPFSMAETVERLERAIEAGGMTLFAAVDHGEGARSVGLTMNDTRVLIFGRRPTELGRRYQVPEELTKPLSGAGALVRAALEG